MQETDVIDEIEEVEVDDTTLINPHLAGDDFWFDGGKVGVLLLHGLTATTSEVRPLAHALHEQGYTVAGPLLPGHGTNPHDLNLVTWRDWVWTAVQSYHHLCTVCDTVFVGGESTGAMIALHLASRYPEIAGVLCYAPATKLMISQTDIMRIYAASSFVPWAPKKKGKSNPQWQGYRVNPLRGVMALLRLQKEMESRYYAIHQPMLIMQGRLDPTVDPTSGQIILDGISTNETETELVWLEESAHVILLEDELPQIVEKTLSFMSKVATL